MKNIWKWVLGIVIVLVLGGALFAAGFMMHNFTLANHPLQAWGGHRLISPGLRGFGGERIMGGARFPGYYGMMRPIGFGFRPFVLLLGLIPWLIFGALLYGVYQLGKHSVKSNTASATPVQSSVIPENTNLQQPAPAETPTKSISDNQSSINNG